MIIIIILNQIIKKAVFIFKSYKIYKMGMNIRDVRTYYILNLNTRIISGVNRLNKIIDDTCI